MAEWKLCRQTYSNETYEFKEGDEVTVGRGNQNTIILPSLNISRKHCIITVKKDEVIIEDLKSANGIFVGLKKIPPNIPFSLSNNDIIGLGWTDGAPLARVNDAEQFVFKLLKISNDPSLKNRIQYQCEESSEIPDKIINPSIDMSLSKIFKTSSLSLKRKSNTGTEKEEESSTNATNTKNYPNSSLENIDNLASKKTKYNSSNDDVPDDAILQIQNDEKFQAFTIKQECVDDEVYVIDSDSDSEQWYFKLSQNSPKNSFASFNESRKSEDCLQDSSYSQLDADITYIKTEDKLKNETEEEYVDDLISILPPSVDIFDGTYNNKYVKTTDGKNKDKEIPELTATCNNKSDTFNNKSENDMESNHLLSNLPATVLDNTFENEPEVKENEINENNKTSTKNDQHHEQNTACGTNIKESTKQSKKSIYNSKEKIKKNHRISKSSSSKIQITNSQKEERKKKLRALATKDKGENDHVSSCTILKNGECNTNAPKVSAKITTLNRGAFLIDSSPLVSKPSNKKKNKRDNKKEDRSTRKENNVLVNTNTLSNGNEKGKTRNNVNTETKDQAMLKNSEGEELNNKNKKNEDRYNKYRTVSADSMPAPQVVVTDIALHGRRHSDNITKDSNKNKVIPIISGEKTEHFMSSNLTERPNISRFTRKEELSEKSKVNKTKNPNDDKAPSQQKENCNNVHLHHKIQIQAVKPTLRSSIKTILKPMKENKEPYRKSDKKVRFSKESEIVEFEIEQGNIMKKTSTAKSTLLATRSDMPAFSLRKIALVKILRWNPQWLEEQNKVTVPPPILGHNNVPMAILHSFGSHIQYSELIGDLLLMEIWECLTQGYIKTRNVKSLEMRIESLPLIPLDKVCLELINLNVNVSMPTVQAHSVPREGEIMLLYFGDDGKSCRFFFVQHVRCLPSPPNNINSFYSISIQTSYTDKIRMLQRGTVIYGISLAYINKDLKLFEAMEYLSRSPLNEVILNPQPKHFALDEADTCAMESQWTTTLNDSQRKAVMYAVSAARGERPRIHMIQGPPGTGKSRVICSIVMEYFYDAASKKQKNRGKILICATSNAAVDELVIRLLDIRQALPQPERLKLVRTGRVEAMHPRARDISSLKLAQRDAARLQPEPALQPAAVSAEISLLEAKKNMWKTKAMSAGDDARVAYCHSRVAEIEKKIALFRTGSSATCGPEQVAQAERRVLEGADVVLTTLASAQSPKMRGLAGRIALCVVDEAGQALEPETLAPLSLGVTHLVLVGDPQQLPGFICSQRAKQHGLGESLFSRLSSCAEAWAQGGPVLLDRQYRMHPHIADYPNRAFYEGRVRNETEHAPMLGVAPYFVLGILNGNNGQDASGANEAEAWGAARVALALRPRLPAAARSLAVITPYVAQRDLVRRHARALLQAEGGGEEGEVEVNTVDSFQGQERAVVVVSLARSHGLGFLATAGRMNVLLTRAKHVLVLCLNPRAVEHNHQWRSLVEDAQRRNLFGMLPIQMCQPPSIQRISNQEILSYLSCNPPHICERDQYGRYTSRKNKNKYKTRNKHVRKR